uniref:Cyclin-like domain-containing protein n=1 Tax=Ascaris lumbricoides TaxID=6252 RepID=A0A9J2Q2X5_ASCLU
MVLEESAIVLDVTYQERSGAGSTLVGQFISHDHEQRHTFSGVPGLPHQEPREVTYMKGKKLIVEIASQLRINQHCIDTAHNFFRMCVCRNFTRGRMRSHVVAACLYMTCRLENTAHLLLDFSDVTQVNVFELGRTLNFLARSLKINLPTKDPCLYILRFAVLLEFGEKEKEVVSLATRLVQRMKRDWIATGRRPTGLCGAALLLAARCYNFNRTIGDIVRVVHISEAVVRKRLDEFGKTPSSSLTIDEFAIVDLENCEDPPAFRESRRRANEELKRKEEQKAKEIELEVVMIIYCFLTYSFRVKPLEEEVEKALERKRREKFKRTLYAKMLTDSLVKESPELRLADAMIRNEIVEVAFDAGEERQRPLMGMSSRYAPTLESLGISDPLKPQPATSEHTGRSEENGNDELDFKEIDDDEIDTYILSREEAETKSRLWMKLNKEHLVEMELREQEGAERERGDDGIVRKKRKKSTNIAKRKESIVASTAQEAITKVIQEKKLSNKIDYEILKEVMDSESSVMKPFYPCRAEIISSLGGDPPDGENALKGGRLPKYKCVPSSSTTANQSDTAVLPGKKGSEDESMVVKLLPRPSWFRSGNAVRFKNSTCSVRHLQNLRSRPDVLKEEKSLSEGNGSQSSQLPSINANFKEDEVHEEASLLLGSQRKLASTLATMEVTLLAETTDAGQKEEGTDFLNRTVESVSGEVQSEQNALRVARSRYAKFKPRLATAKVKKKAADQPANASSNAAGPSTAAELISSAAKDGAVENLRKESNDTIPVSMQQSRKSCIVVEEKGPKMLGTAESWALGTRLAAIAPNVCTIKRIASHCITPASEETASNLKAVLEGDRLRAPKVVASSTAEIHYAKARPSLRGNGRAMFRNVDSTEKQSYAPPDCKGQQLHSAPEVHESTTLTGRKRSAVAERRVPKGNCLGQLLNITGLEAMAALGRDSNSTCPRASIIHSSARWTSKLASSSNDTSVDSSGLSACQSPLTSRVSQTPSSDRSINNLLTVAGSASL